MEWLKEWALPLSAGATFLLALVAVWSILYTGYIRRKDIDNSFKARLLEEIRVWAVETRKFLINEGNWDNPIGETADKLQANLENTFIPNHTITRSSEWLDDQLKLQGKFKKYVKDSFDLLQLCITTLKGEELDKTEPSKRRILSEQDKTYLGASLRLVLESIFDIKVRYRL
jgi:hypothetical protein